MPHLRREERRLTRHLAAAVIAAGLVVTAAGTRAAEDTETMVAFFTDIVFGTEMDSAEPGTVYVKKWLQPLRVAVSSVTGEVVEHPDGKRELQLSREKPDSEHLKAIQKHLRTIVGITGVATEDAKQEDKPVNVQIQLVPRLAMGAPFIEESVDPRVLQALAEPGVCYFLTWADKSGAIVRALVVANNELPPADFSACMLEELTQIMGLAGESNRITPSVFNEDTQLQELAPIDRVLLKGLYDERIAPGSHPDEARAAAAKVLPELARDNP